MAKGDGLWRKYISEEEFREHYDYAYNLMNMMVAFKENINKEAGYKTFFAGKWHLGTEGSYPQDHGFDINQGGFEQGGPYTGGYFSPFNNPQMEDYEDEVGMSLPAKLAKETTSFISQHRDTTFFDFLSFYAVHSPIQSTREKWEKYRNKAEEMGIAETGFKMGHFLPMRPVTGADFYPTLLELTGQKLRPDEHQDGVSLVPLLSGGSIEERFLIWHYPHYGNQGGQPSAIIREGDWKLIHYYEDGREELYNLETDLEETTDVSSENPELTKQLSEQLFAYLNEVGARFPEKDPEYNEEMEKQYLERIRTVRIPELEKQRLEFLYKDFDPGNNWWGSQVEDKN